MNWLRSILVLVLAVGLAAAQASAAQRKRAPRPTPDKQTGQAGPIKHEGRYWIEEETGTVPAGARLQVMSSQGGIELRGGGQREITYYIRKRVAASSEEAAKRALNQYRVQTRRVRDVVYLVFSAPPGLNGDFVVAVPKELERAELHTQGGGILAQDIGGALQATTGGGSIQADDIGGAVHLITAGGPIAIGKVGGSVDAQTEGGEVHLASAGGNVSIVTRGGAIDIGKVKGSVHAKTAGGEIQIIQAGGNVNVESAGGHITIGDGGGIFAVTTGGTIRVDRARGAVHAQTGVGEITLFNCGGPVQAESAAGSITARIAASRSAWAQSVLQTNIGDIQVFLPSELAVSIQAAIDAATRSQTIESDFPLTLRGGQAFGPRGIFGEGAINGGGPQLRLRTTTGTIQIRSQR